MKRKQSLDLTAMGALVLNNLEAGRAQLHAQRRAQAKFWKKVITDYAWLDQRDGHPRRGLARRIAGRLRNKLSERQIRKYLASLANGSD